MWCFFSNCRPFSQCSQSGIYQHFRLFFFCLFLGVMMCLIGLFRCQWAESKLYSTIWAFFLIHILNHKSIADFPALQADMSVFMNLMKKEDLGAWMVSFMCGASAFPHQSLNSSLIQPSWKWSHSLLVLILLEESWRLFFSHFWFQKRNLWWGLAHSWLTIL